MRAARWLRESTERQRDQFGPDAQREQQDRAMVRYGLVDTGLSWSVAHSGRTIAGTAEWAEMMAAAGVGYDVLVVGYVSRFARDLRTAVNARHDLHAVGAAILFADERVLSSDPEAWETFAREAVEAEAYSRRLARRVTEGYAAKFRRHRDPGGNPPLGFRRVDGFLVPDPSSIGRVVAAFERYATGTVSLRDLGDEAGIDHEALKAMVRNPVYNGWVRRHRRGPDEQLLPAAWRDDPPVSDALWARVQEVRADRDTGGGRSTVRHAHLLAGRLFCPCGDRIRGEAQVRGERILRRYRHRDRCASWAVDTRSAAAFDGPIAAQVTGARLRPAHVAALRGMAEAGTPRPDSTSLRRRQAERELDELARRHARRAIATPAYLAEHERLTTLLDAIRDVPAPAPVVDPDAAAAWVRDLPGMWRRGTDEERRDLVAAVYDRIVVTSEGFVSARLTEDALAHGMAWALPEVVAGARPEGDGHPRATTRIPIEGAGHWRRALRTA